MDKARPDPAIDAGSDDSLKASFEQTGAGNKTLGGSSLASVELESPNDFLSRLQVDPFDGPLPSSAIVGRTPGSGQLLRLGQVSEGESRYRSASVIRGRIRVARSSRHWMAVARMDLPEAAQLGCARRDAVSDEDLAPIRQILLVGGVCACSVFSIPCYIQTFFLVRCPA